MKDGSCFEDKLYDFFQKNESWIPISPTFIILIAVLFVGNKGHTKKLWDVWPFLKWYDSSCSTNNLEWFFSTAKNMLNICRRFSWAAVAAAPCTRLLVMDLTALFVHNTLRYIIRHNITPLSHWALRPSTLPISPSRIYIYYRKHDNPDENVIRLILLEDDYTYFFSLFRFVSARVCECILCRCVPD